MKSIIALLFVCSCMTSVTLAAKEDAKVKNIIVLVGDGMGAAAVKAYRMFKDNPNTIAEEKTLFDSILVGTLSTNSIDPKENITDSAASATAYATGRKTINGALSIDTHHKPFPTVLEKAKKLGKSTGLVVTSELSHATPAAFATHYVDRDHHENISDQLFDNQYQNRPMVDVLLGGGRKYFQRSSRNLIEAFKAQDYHFVDNRQDLLKSNSQQLLGIFAEEGLARNWDRGEQIPSLVDMTQVALKQLSQNPQGFFLVVEASQIDWAAHDNDIIGILAEMEDFERALKAVLDFAKNDKQTLVIATADHETGGLSIGSKASGKDVYHWNFDVLKTFKYTPEKIARLAIENQDIIAEFEKATSLKLTAKEKRRLKKVKLKKHEKVYRAINKIISKRSFTGWTTYGHTGEDVYLYAYGPQSHRLYGHWDNTKVGQFIFEMLKP